MVVWGDWMISAILATALLQCVPLGRNSLHRLFLAWTRRVISSPKKNILLILFFVRVGHYIFSVKRQTKGALNKPLLSARTKHSTSATKQDRPMYVTFRLRTGEQEIRGLNLHNKSN